MAAIRSSETRPLTTATRRNFPEGSILPTGHWCEEIQTRIGPRRKARSAGNHRHKSYGAFLKLCPVLSLCLSVCLSSKTLCQCPRLRKDVPSDFVSIENNRGYCDVCSNCESGDIYPRVMWVRGYISESCEPGDIYPRVMWVKGYISESHVSQGIYIRKSCCLRRRLTLMSPVLHYVKQTSEVYLYQGSFLIHPLVR
jgi:hypothetical protein